jgi:hypothetical protein
LATSTRVLSRKPRYCTAPRRSRPGQCRVAARPVSLTKQRRQRSPCLCWLMPDVFCEHEPQTGSRMERKAKLANKVYRPYAPALVSPLVLCVGVASFLTRDATIFQIRSHQQLSGQAESLFQRPKLVQKSGPKVIQSTINCNRQWRTLCRNWKSPQASIIS